MSGAALVETLRLMLIDDHDAARSALERRLSSDPRVSIVASTASLPDALAAIEKHRPHAALVDHRRRDGDGFYIVAQLDALPAARRPLVALHSAYIDAMDWLRARQAGADEWFLKQIGVETMVSRLLDAAHRRLPAARWNACGK